MIYLLLLAYDSKRWTCELSRRLVQERIRFQKKAASIHSHQSPFLSKASLVLQERIASDDEERVVQLQSEHKTGAIYKHGKDFRRGGGGRICFVSRFRTEPYFLR